MSTAAASSDSAANPTANPTADLAAKGTPGKLEDIYYGGFSRFNVELEFVQSLANPFYLVWLAEQKYFDKPEFVNYLNYLRYFKRPEYAKFMQYPTALHALDHLQEEQFRKDIIKPEIFQKYVEGIKPVADSTRS